MRTQESFQPRWLLCTWKGVGQVHACGGNGRWTPPPYISRNRGEPIKTCARTITYARRGGLDTHGIFHVHRNKARQHNANAMCTLNLMSGTCPKTCGNGQGALAQVFRALTHVYWPTYPNKIDQSRSFVQVHVHFIHNHFPSS